MERSNLPISIEAYPGLMIRWKFLMFAGFTASLCQFFVLIYLMDNKLFPPPIHNFLFSSLDVCGLCSRRHGVLQAFDGRSGNVYAVLIIPFFINLLLMVLALFALFKKMERRAIAKDPSIASIEPGVRWKLILEDVLLLMVLFWLMPSEINPGRVGHIRIFLPPIYPFLLSLAVCAIGTGFAKILSSYFMKQRGIPE